MTIRFRCQRCQTSVRAKDNLSGRKVKCPNCNKYILVPEPEPAEVGRGGTITSLQMGWWGLISIVLSLGIGFTVRSFRFPEWLKLLKLGIAVGVMVFLFVGGVLSLLGIIQDRGRVGGILGLIAGFLFLVYLAVQSGLK